VVNLYYGRTTYSVLLVTIEILVWVSDFGFKVSGLIHTVFLVTKENLVSVSGFWFKVSG